MTLVDVFQYVKDGGTIAVLLLVIVGGWKGWYIWKREADDLRSRIKSLESRLERATRTAETGTDALDRTTRWVERHSGAPDAS